MLGRLLQSRRAQILPGDAWRQVTAIESYTIHMGPSEEIFAFFPANMSPWTSAAPYCRFFVIICTTYSRDPDGQYIVELPCKHGSQELEDSLRGAVSRLYAVERRLQRDMELRKQYSKFMNEYFFC